MKRTAPILFLIASLFGCARSGDDQAPAGAPTVTDEQGAVHGLGYTEPAERMRHGVLYWAPSKLLGAPASYDIRALGQVAPIRDQKQCGSCWAFATTTALESARIKAGQPALDLAEQAIVSCDTKHAAGCNGGSMAAMDYLVKTGLPTEASFPYTATTGTCHAAAVVAKGTRWGYIGAQGRAPTLDEIKNGLQAYGVLPATVSAGGGDWSKGGHMTGCSNKGTNHMIGLAGWTTADELIIKNSWGTGWSSADKGYAYAKQGCDQLASTEQSVSFIVVDGATPSPTSPPHISLPAEIDAQLGVEIAIGVRPEAGVTYSWTAGGQKTSDTGSLIYVTPNADTIYQITATTAAGSAQSSVKVHLVAGVQ